MRIVVNRAKLNSELSFLGPASRDLNAGFIALAAADGQLSITTHNGFSQLSTVMNADVQEPGKACVTVKALPGVVATFDKSGSDVTLASDERAITATWGDFTGRFPTRVYHGDLPLDAPTVYSCDATLLRRMLAMVAPSTEVGSRITVMLLAADGPNMLAAATDGRRLTEVVFGQPTLTPYTVSINQLASLRNVVAAGSEATIRVGRHIVAECNGRQTAWPTSPDLFPDYKRIFPTTINIILRFSREALLAAVKRVGVIADGDLAITLTPAGNSLTVASWKGEATEHVDCAPVVSTDVLAVNSKYLCDALAAIETAECEILVDAASKPIMIQPVSPVGYTHRSVIMPLNRS